MRAVVWSGYGEPAEVLGVGDVDPPAPARGQVLVRVAAASIHAGDWLEVTGHPYAVRLAAGIRRPRRTTPGRDVAGTVEAVGEGVTRLRPGDAVFGECTGALAELAVGDEDRLSPRPAALSPEQAAAVPTSAITALRAMRDRGEVAPGTPVLVNGASGGVGTFAVQIAKALGAEVTGVCSTPHLDLVRSLGADHVIDYTAEDFTRSGARYDVILDNAGTRSLTETRRALTDRGILIPNNGTTGGRWFGTIGRILGALALSPFVRHRLRPFFATVDSGDLEALTAMIDAGSVAPVIAASYGLDAIAEAFDHVGTGHAAGKVVVSL